MGKKKGNKKGGGDDYWDEAGELLPPNLPNAGVDGADDEPVTKTKNAFASMQIEESTNGADGGDDEEEGGLMAAIKKSNAGGKKGGKKGKKQKEEIDWDAIEADMAPENGPADEDSKAAIPRNMDEEFPIDDEKVAKGNKKAGDADGASTPVAGDDPEDDGAPKLLSKKEKEKLKKEKEKAKKKAQAAAKKAAAGGGDDSNDVKPTPPAETPTPAPENGGGGDDDDEDGEEGGGGASAADKKKKKKKKKAAEPAPAPAATTKKPNAALAALQARMAAQKKAEEEARAAEEAARKAEEEAERKEKEEEERKEAERQRKKEKEKAKKEQLRKEGKLLTPKQKAEKQAAEARLQAMIKSGQVKVDGLSKGNDAGPSEGKQRTAVVDKKPKKRGQQKSGPNSLLLEPAASPKEEEAKAVSVERPEEARADSPVQAAEPETAIDEEDEDVADAWDADSDEDDAKPAQPAKKDITPSGMAEQNGSSNKAGAEQGEQSSDEDDDDDDSEDDSDDDSSDDELTTAQRQAAERKALAAQRRDEQHKQALAARSKDNLRSPICCILGHVDTGKTKLLDKIRQTNVQEGEAGGITQQIGATYFPVETLQQKIAPIDPEGKQEFKTPGLLVIDTPGHESFTNLRTRGSSLCNIAILVVDIMHGLEPQTLESIRLLRDKKTPFIVALNKVDRLYGWKATPDGAFRHSLANQDRATRNEFEERASKVMVAFAEQGLNAVLYYDNKNFAKNVSLVPTSAHTGEGIPDMLQLLVNLTQERMSERLMYLSELECTVLEVKVIEGLGTTIDVVLSNGTMNEGDKIVVCGLNGPIVTQVRALLTPQPMKEMRIKGAYVHHKHVKAALGVKISAPDLEKAIAGSRLLVCGPDDDEEELKEEVMSDLTGLLDSVDKSGKGVCVQASTLGSLEALLEFLRTSKIPVSGINIGPVYKKDVMRASTILEKARELACILCFDVTVDKEAERLADELGVRLFKADIIYHLFDAFTKYNAEVLETKKKEAAPTAVWPVRLKILACFARRDPIILGAELLDNTDLRVGTPLCVVKGKEIVDLGRVTSLEVNHKQMTTVSKKDAGAGVAVKIETNSGTPPMFGRHFEESDVLYSHISRASIDALKNLFWDSVTLEQKKLIKNLKPLFNIP
ncbi:hypothetical protein BDZ90DRAFT_236114 [Jaminaea rosea]|uniref:Eukaryotic translation initiation factor 5B n=1 Tax=Jaminaea rosea TaxID=1569628 RepID=A0A316V3L0_9BASI|nr:hypothetical protein BDZ90DRAFT_236114 [Jaminaea rosea]PWN30783.1 hypothetical protein BDZ90DRAFT_236114 [Jaminaea rosea]